MAESPDILVPFRAEEAALRFRTFTNDDAIALGLRLADTARTEGKAITIDVSRNGQQLFHLALPGTTADNDAWIERKKRVVNRFGKSTFHVAAECRVRGVSFEARTRLDPDLYAAAGGGFPVVVDGVGLVGVVAVSGLPQAEDHAFLVRVLGDFLRERRGEA